MDIDTLNQMHRKMQPQNNISARGNGSGTRGNGHRTRGGGRQSPGGRLSAATRDTECFYCHKFGHFARDCYKKQRDE